MSRSHHFFTTPTNYRSLAITSSKEDDYQIDIETRASRLIDEQAALLTKDAAALNSTRNQLEAQKRLLNKANTITANIKIQILKYQRQLSLYATRLEQCDPMDDNAIAQLTLKQNKAQKALTHALQRKDKVTHEIPRIETALHQIQNNNSAADEKFIRHYPWQFPVTKAMYQSFIAVEVSFIPFMLKTVGLSVLSCATAWKLPEPSPEVAFVAALPFALCDSAFSVLLYNSHTWAVNDVFKFYEKHKLKSYQRILHDSLLETFSSFSLLALALGVFNQLAIKEHNLLGGASIIIGIKDYWLFQAMGAGSLAFFIPALIGAVGFYGVILDPKYKEGMQNNKAYKQVLNTFRKLFSQDYPRGFDVLYRGLFSNAFLRALMFYYLAYEVRKMSDSLNWVNPTVAFALIFHHTIVSRYKGAYEPSFAKKEHELVQIFVDLKLKKAYDQVIETRVNVIYQSMVTSNNKKKKNKRLSDEKLKLAAKEKFNNTLVPEVLEAIELERLKLAAEMHLAYSHDAKLTIEREQQRALKRIRAQAEIEANEYLEDQIEELLELRTWQDFAIDLRGSVVIGSLRALFGYILMSTYGMALVEYIEDDSLAEETTEFIKLTSSLTLAMLFFSIYFNSCRQTALEAKAVACHTDDDINDSDIKEIIAAEDATEQALVESKTDEEEIKASPANPSLSLTQEISPTAEVDSKPENIKTKYNTILKIGTGLAITIAGGSWALRLVSGLYQTIFPFIGIMDEKVLVSLITLSLAEQGVLNLNIFYPDLEETILSNLLRSKYFQIHNSETEVVSANSRVSFYLHNPWAIFRRSTINSPLRSVNTAQLELLPESDDGKVAVQTTPRSDRRSPT